MGRKRINKLEAGGKTTLYIPQDIDPNVLKFLQDQKNLSKALIELAYMYVYQISAPNSPWMGSLGSAMIINKPQDTESENKASEDPNKKSKKSEALKSMLDTDKLGI